MAEVDSPLSHLKGQDFVKWLSQDTLRMVRVNHSEGTAFVTVDLPNQANAEASAMRDYRGRYLFELLQNANDAILAAKENDDVPGSGCSRVRIIVTSSALVVANDGVPFQEKDVDSIYRWGESSKDPNKSIGHKGIGFKSVLEVTRSPEIFSQVVQFRFDKGTCERAVRKIVGHRGELKLPITRFVFPYQIDDAPSPDRDLIRRLLFDEAFSTVIRLPLRVSQKEVWERIAQDIQPTLLLFLNAIDRIEISNDGGIVRALRKLASRSEGDLGQDITLFEGQQRLSRWLLFDAAKQPIDDRSIIRDLDDKAWERVQRVGFAAAFPLDEEGRLDGTASEPRHLFVYFPTTVATCLRYLVHGDFYIDAARKEVNDRPYNRWLAAQLASFTRSKVMPELVRRFPQDPRIVKILVPTGQPAGFAAQLEDEIHKALRSCPFVPAAGRDYVTPVHAILTPQGATIAIGEFRRFFPADKLSRKVRGRQFPMPEVERDEATVQFLISLGARRLTSSDAFGLLDGQPPVIDESEYPTFYDFLWSWREQLAPHARAEFSESLAASHCIVTDRGVWIRPYEHLYHAKLRQETPNMPRAVAADLVHPAAYNAEGRAGPVYRLLDTLQPAIRDYDAPDIIRNAIIPLFEGSRFQRLSLDLRIEIYRYLFGYWRSRRGSGDPDVERVKGQVQVPARLLTNRRQDLWLPADGVYLSSFWTKDDRLEQLYAGLDVPFLYQVRGLELDSTDPEEWARFWEWLGVATMPRILIEEVPRDEVTSRRRAFLRHHHPHGGTRLWLKYLDETEAEYGTCSVHLGLRYRQLRRSVSLHGFADFVERRKGDRLVLLYELLADNWSRLPENALEAEVYCYRRDCPHYARSDQVPSFLAYMLRNAEWIPARTNKEGSPSFELRRPRHCWLVSSAENPIVRNLLPTPPFAGDKPGHQQFRQYIGLRSVEQATRTDLVEMLRRLPEEHPDPNIAVYSGRRSVPRALGAFSRWVIGRIDNLLAPLGAQERSELREHLPLIASQGDMLCYVHPPDTAFFADDRYHTVRWRAHLPFVQMDDNCQDAARFLGVRFISQCVDESCVPGDVLQAESDRLMNRFKTARPYMLAIIKEQRESELQEAALYLSRLDLVVVDRLVVHRRLTIPPAKDIADGEARLYLDVTTGRRSGSAGRAPRSGTLYVREGCDAHYDLMAGPIAEYIRMPSLADAFVVLLDRGGKEGRLRFLQTRGLGEEHVQEMRLLLGYLGLGDDPEPENDDSILDRHLLQQVELEVQKPPALTVAPEGPGPPKTPSRQDDGEPQSLQTIEFPPLNLSEVELVNVLSTDGRIPETAVRHRGKIGGGGGRPDWEKDQRLREAYGERGEQVVKLIEAERLRRLGWTNPDGCLQWRREQGDFTADHDFESKDLLDDEWVDIVIEVKATPGLDFRFPMSRDELACAQQYGDRYRLYRVVDILSSAPKVYVFGNPYTLWQQGLALIEPRDTYVVLPDPRKHDPSLFP